MPIELIKFILGKAMEIGVPAVLEGLDTIGKDNVTREDIVELFGDIKPPEDY